MAKQAPSAAHGRRAKVERPSPAAEIIFVVEEAPEGGLIARALGASIFTEADSAHALRRRIREAVDCHFEARRKPRIIRLHFVREEVMAA